MEDIAKCFTVQKKPASEDVCRHLGREVFDRIYGLMMDGEWQGRYIKAEYEYDRFNNKSTLEYRICKEDYPICGFSCYFDCGSFGGVWENAKDGERDNLGRCIYAGGYDNGKRHGIGVEFIYADGSKNSDIAVAVQGLWQEGELTHIICEDRLVPVDAPESNDDARYIIKLFNDAADVCKNVRRKETFCALAEKVLNNSSSDVSGAEHSWKAFSESKDADERTAAAERFVSLCDGNERETDRLIRAYAHLADVNEEKYYDRYTELLIPTFTVREENFDATDHNDYSGYSNYTTSGFVLDGKFYGFIYVYHTYNDNPYNSEDVTRTCGITRTGDRVDHGVKDFTKLIGEPLPPELLVERDSEGKIIFCGLQKNGLRHGLGFETGKGIGFWRKGVLTHVVENSKLVPVNR